MIYLDPDTERAYLRATVADCVAAYAALTSNYQRYERAVPVQGDYIARVKFRATVSA